MLADKSKCIPKSFCRIIILIMSTFVWQSIVFGQSDADFRWANEVIQAANAGLRADKLAAVTTVLNRFKAQRGLGINEREFIQFLEFQKSYLAIDPNGLSANLNDALRATTPEARKAALNAGRIELIQRFEAASHNLSPNTITADDAKNLLSALRSASQSLDDIQNFSFVGGTSAITSLLSRASGILNLVESIRDPQAKDIVAGMSSTIGSLGSKLQRIGVAVPNPMKAFDFPLAVSTAQIQVTKDGFEKTTAAMDDIAKAIGGDSEALARLPQRAKDVNDSLSMQKFGAAMANAIADRIAGSIPLVRSLVSWLKPVPRVPSIERQLRIQIHCDTSEQDGHVEVTQTGEMVKGVMTDAQPGCYGRGEVLFEGRFKEGNIYEITIYEIWNKNVKKVHRGILQVNNPRYMFMKADTLDSPQAKGLFK